MAKNTTDKPAAGQAPEAATTGTVTNPTPAAVTPAPKIMATTETQEALKAAQAQHQGDLEAMRKLPDDATLEQIREANKGLDPLAPADRLTLRLPSSDLRMFVYLGKVFPQLAGRLGDGPCAVLKTVPMPCGDLAISGDTFDPVAERMTPGRYTSLVQRGFISKADDKTEAQLVAAAMKRAEAQKATMPPTASPGAGNPSSTTKLDTDPDKAK